MQIDFLVLPCNNVLMLCVYKTTRKQLNNCFIKQMRQSTAPAYFTLFLNWWASLLNRKNSIYHVMVNGTVKI